MQLAEAVEFARANGNSVMVTKAVSGRAKIDPLVALFQAAILMSWNPSAGRLVTGADILTVI